MKLTQPFDNDVDKFRAIYKWVCDNIENDYQAFSRNKKQRALFANNEIKLLEWNEKFSQQVFKKLKEEHKTVCTGYAYLVREMAKHAGIEAQIIDGYGRNITSNIRGKGVPNHSWNAVKLNGSWYLCDPTWSSGYTLAPEIKYVWDFEDGYFLADPRLFVLSHYPLDTSKMFLENPPSLTDFLIGPLVYKGAFKYGIVPISPTKFNVSVEKGETIRLQMNQLFDAELISTDFKVIRENQAQALTASVKRLENGDYSLEFTIDRVGQSTIHVFVKDNVILSYTVDVNKK
jgi:transglutaminase/protease-like cytokinesis protein 3